jgi:hypothetical protein
VTSRLDGPGWPDVELADFSDALGQAGLDEVARLVTERRIAADPDSWAAIGIKFLRQQLAARSRSRRTRTRTRTRRSRARRTRTRPMSAAAPQQAFEAIPVALCSCSPVITPLRGSAAAPVR